MSSLPGIVGGGKSEPCNYDIEKALLSAMVHESTVIDQFSEGDVDLFYHPSHRAIFLAVLDTHRCGDPLDFHLIASRLNLEEVGGKDYLNSIWEVVSVPEAVGNYREILAEKQDLRSALSMARRVSELAYSHDPDMQELERIANSFRLTRLNKQEDIATVASHVLDLTEYLEKIQDGSLRDPGVKWGFREMDTLIDKLRPGELCLVGGFPGSGKTSILNSVIALSCVPNRIPSLVFSLEMPVRDELMRLVSIAGRIPIARMRRTGGMESEDMTAFAISAKKIHDSAIAIDDSILTIHEILERARDYKGKHGLELVGIDHVQLISIGGTGERARYQGLDEAGRICKWMAKELDCVVMLLTQINRMDESPFECSALEAHADQYIIIPKDDVKNVFIRKNRNGPKGFVELNFYPECAAFY